MYVSLYEYFQDYFPDNNYFPNNKVLKWFFFVCFKENNENMLYDSDRALSMKDLSCGS